MRTGLIYFQRAKLFGSLSGGGHLQVYEVIARYTEDGADIETGITLTNEKANRRAEWTQSIHRNGHPYFTLKLAIIAFEADKERTK